MKTGSILLALLISGAPLGAQSRPETQSAAVTHAQGAAEHVAGCEQFAADDNITPHITDGHCLEVPNGWRIWEPRELVLPRWAPIHLGGLELDMSPTKHVVFMLLGAFLCAVTLITAARAHVKHTSMVGRPNGFSTAIEAMVLYIRNEVAIPNLGPHGEKYTPFILGLFWFILFCNLLGLIPFGSTATGNISVTATLAILTFLVVESAGIRENGWGYLNTIFYWNKDLNIGLRIPMFILMTPLELIGKLTKPFALALRLFVNMMSGHIVVLALISMVFAFKSYLLGTAPIAMAVGIMMLELFVSFLQAFIFALLSSVFIGQMREGHH